MSVPTFSRMIRPWAIGGLLLGCGGTGPTDSAPTTSREVGSVGLFVEDGPVTDHVVLYAGQTLRIEVRLYAADGVRIQPADGAHVHGDEHRVGVAVLHTRPLGRRGEWASALVYGANVPAGGRARDAWLLETNVELDGRNAVFGRAEYLIRTPGDRR